MYKSEYTSPDTAIAPPAGQEVTVLLDLKPALDGYAGIPQESRLLFLGLRTLKNVKVEGMIQHGARMLRAAISPKSGKLTASQRINRHSRTVVSMHETPYSSVVDAINEAIQRYFAFTALRLRIMTGSPVKLGIFDSSLFADFIWRTLFNKTLNPSDKEVVTSARYRILLTPKSLLFRAGLAGLKFSSRPSFVPIDTRGYDVFLAQTPFPGRVSKGTALVIRYHDAVPVLMPHVISDKAFHQASHFYTLQENVRAGAWFCCISEATRRDLLQIFPEAESRSVVIHNIVSSEYFYDESSRKLIFQIVPNRLGTAVEFKTKLTAFEFQDTGAEPEVFEYLLMVSTIEPRKNHLLLLQAWERLKYTSMPKLKLIIVGNAGWDHEPILKAFRPWAERGDLFYLNNVPSSELRVLYRHAAATVCPSLAEGFDYAGIEAMRSGGIVVSSDIPVHREIYEDASEYFSPYSPDDAASVIRRVLEDDGVQIRSKLREAGQVISDRYTPGNILPKWNAFVQRLKGLSNV